MVSITIGFLTGLLVGFVFFRGLAWTLGLLFRVRHPAVLMLLSFLVRFGVVAFAFYLQAVRGDITGVVAALVGFIIMRFILISGRKHPLPQTYRG